MDLLRSILGWIFAICLDALWGDSDYRAYTAPSLEGRRSWQYETQSSQHSRRTASIQLMTTGRTELLEDRYRRRCLKGSTTPFGLLMAGWSSLWAIAGLMDLEHLADEAGVIHRQADCTTTRHLADASDRCTGLRANIN